MKDMWLYFMYIVCVCFCVYVLSLASDNKKLHKGLFLAFILLGSLYTYGMHFNKLWIT